MFRYRCEPAYPPAILFDNYRKMKLNFPNSLVVSVLFINHEYKLRLTWSIFRKFNVLFPNIGLKATVGFAAPNTDSTQSFKSLLKKWYIN